MRVGQEIVRFGRELIGRQAPATPRTEIERFGDPTFQAFTDTWLRYHGQIY